MAKNKQTDIFIEKDKSMPFSRRVLTFVELYNRYNQIFIQCTTERVGKKEFSNLLLELETIKKAINNMLPEYSYPNKNKK